MAKRSGILQWSIVGTALVVWFVVLGCVILPQHSSGGAADKGARVRDDEVLPIDEGNDVALASRPAPTNLVTSKDGLPYCCVGMQIQRLDWIDKYKKSMDEIAALGADTVKLVIDTRMERIDSTRVYLDMRMTPTPEQLADLIKHAKSKKLRVILMPIVLLDNPREEPPDWRGTIEPDERFGGWDDWFNSYRSMMNQFAWIAEGNGVDVLVIGSEFVSAEPFVDQWVKTIDSVRKVYHGRLTYSSNWDHYEKVKFWDHLDLIGMNSYWKFGERDTNEDPSVDHIQKRWQEIQRDLLPWVKKQGKPLLFLEIGWFSQKNVAYEPWDYTKGQPIDLELQRKLYEGFFKSWWGNPQLGGFSVWEWPPVEGGPEDGGYTPKNKPAEKVIREWLAKPRWKVE